MLEAKPPHLRDPGHRPKQMPLNSERRSLHCYPVAACSQLILHLQARALTPFASLVIRRADPLL